MNKQFFTNILVIFTSFSGVASVIAPASAESIGGAITKTEIPQPAKTLIQTSGVAEVNKGFTANILERTSTSIGQLAGISTDSRTNAEVANPTQAQLPSLNNLTEIIQTTGDAKVGVETSKQETRVDAEADLAVQVGQLAKVNICLDGSAFIGSRDGGSFADCSKRKTRKVTEPTALGSIALVGAYFISRRRKGFQSQEHQSV